MIEYLRRTTVSSWSVGLLALYSASGMKLHGPPPGQESPIQGTIQVIPYIIEGQTAAEVCAALSAHGPVDEQGRKRYARAEWSVSWRRPEGGPTSWSRAAVNYEIILKVPVLRTGSEALEQRWLALARTIALHELNHARPVIAQAPQIAEQIRAAAARGMIRSDRDAHVIGNRILAQLRAGDLDYDRSTRHGLTEGISCAALE